MQGVSVAFKWNVYPVPQEFDEISSPPRNIVKEIGTATPWASMRRVTELPVSQNIVFKQFSILEQKQTGCAPPKSEWMTLLFGSSRYAGGRETTLERKWLWFNGSTATWKNMVRRKELFPHLPRRRQWRRRYAAGCVAVSPLVRSALYLSRPLFEDTTANFRPLGGLQQLSSNFGSHRRFKLMLLLASDCPKRLIHFIKFYM